MLYDKVDDACLKYYNSHQILTYSPLKEQNLGSVSVECLRNHIQMLKSPYTEHASSYRYYTPLH